MFACRIVPFSNSQSTQAPLHPSCFETPRSAGAWSDPPMYSRLLSSHHCGSSLLVLSRLALYVHLPFYAPLLGDRSVAPAAPYS